ncbi:MAG: hypothetical protein ACYDAZ_06680 [Thermoplasmataceae archaeon]
MRITEVDRRIDIRCILAVRQNSDLFSITAMSEEQIPAYAFNENGKTFLQLFFHKDSGEMRKLSAILSRPDIVEKKSYYSVTERVNNIKEMRILAELLEISSVVINNTYLVGDELFLDFRYHHSRKDKVNSVLSSLIGVSDNVRIVKLGRSSGLRERMEEIDRETPLTMVQFSVPVPKDSPSMEQIVMDYPDTVGEIESRRMTDKGVRALLHTSKPVKVKGVEEVSEKDCVYEAYLYENAFMEGRKRGNESRIPRIAYFITLEDGRLYDTTFVPTAEVEEYISILMSMAREFGKDAPILESYSPLSDDIWEWL